MNRAVRWFVGVALVSLLVVIAYLSVYLPTNRGQVSADQTSQQEEQESVVTNSPTDHPTARSASPSKEKLPKSGPEIRTIRGAFDPLVGAPRSFAPAVLFIPEDSPDQFYYLVQFADPPLDADKAHLRAEGARLLEYVPDFAFVARIDPNQLAAVRHAPNVRWIGLLQPAFKLSPRLDGSLQDPNPLDLQVRVYPQADVNVLEQQIAGIGGTVSSTSSYNPQGGTIIRVAIAGRQIATLARMNGIAWIDLFTAPKLQ